MIKIELSEEKLAQLIKKGLGLDIIAMLQMAENGHIAEYGLESPKLISILQTCVRKGLIGEKTELTLEGKELLEFLSSKEEGVKLVKKKPKDDPFEKWWKEYPGTDTFEYKGKTFKGTRSLRVKKEDCKIKIQAILNSGEYTIEELVEALKLEKEQKAENSYKTGTNKMTYFQGSITYLNQNTYDPYVELVRKGHKAKQLTEEKSLSGGVDI